MTETVQSPAVRRGIKPRGSVLTNEQLSGARLGIDYAWHGAINTAAMKRAGVTFVCRYLSHDPGKNLTHSEASTLTRAGLDVAVVWETTANRALSGHAGGVADAQAANAQARACGAPPEAPIYFAVDWDANDAQKRVIKAYLEGAASVIGRDRVGCYAGYWVIKYLFDNHVISYGWQTYAWSGGHRDPRAQLYQYHNGVRVAGIDSDWNRAYAADFGQWDATPQPSPATWFNAPGEKHNDQWRKPKNSSTALYYANGTPTGAWLDTADQLWPGHEGTIQLDFKERVTHGEKHFVFSRGGYIPGHPPQPYGHVWVGDLAEPLGDVVPAGDGRGAPAPLGRLVTLDVQDIPDGMNYKASDSSPWRNYGDAGLKYGQPGTYSYMLWSSPRVEEGYDGPLKDKNAGGGIVRALIPSNGHLYLCNVQRLHCASLDANGVRNGTVVLAYCSRSGLYGWVVVAHQLNGQELVHHIV